MSCQHTKNALDLTQETNLLWHDTGTVAHRHRLDTCADTAVNLAGSNLQSDVVDCLQTRGALTVEGADGRRVGESG